MQEGMYVVPLEADLFGSDSVQSVRGMYVETAGQRAHDVVGLFAQVLAGVAHAWTSFPLAERLRKAEGWREELFVVSIGMATAFEWVEADVCGKTL